MTTFVRGTIRRTRAHVEPLRQVTIQLAEEVPVELEEPLDIQQVATSQVVAQFAVVQAAASSSEAQPVVPEEALLVAVRSEAVATDMNQHLSSLFLEAVEEQ